jgi:hypothetical protein
MKEWEMEDPSVEELLKNILGELKAMKEAIEKLPTLIALEQRRVKRDIDAAWDKFLKEEREKHNKIMEYYKKKKEEEKTEAS